MLNLAKEILEYKGTVNDVKTLTLHLILDAVCSAKVILVPYDCDKNHSPFLDNGHQAYWCIIVGVVIRASKQTKNIQNLLSHCQKHPTIEHIYTVKEFHPNACSCLESIPNSDVFVVTRHGKSRHLGFWKLDDLIKSIGNLTELGPDRDPEDYAIPTGGLSECLQSKFVLLE